MPHTPGLWYTHPKPNALQALIYVEGTGKDIAVCYDPRDAHLIASAPALLDIAEDCLHQLSTDSDLDEILGAPKYRALVETLRGAIACATGKDV